MPDLDPFCPICDVSLDLHPEPYDEDDPGCEGAEAKARVLAMFGQGMLR